MSICYLSNELNKISENIDLITEQSIKSLFYELCLSSEESYKITRNLLINKPFIWVESDVMRNTSTIIKDLKLYNKTTDEYVIDLSLLNNNEYTNKNDFSIVLIFKYTDLFMDNPSKKDDMFEACFNNLCNVNKINLFSIFKQNYESAIQLKRILH